MPAGMRLAAGASLLIVGCWLPGCSTIPEAPAGLFSPGTEERRGAARPGEFDWRLPLGFPPPLVPSANPMSAAKVELGRHLFYDPRLSGSGEFSCASCHRQELAFTDGRPRSVGATGDRHPRAAMSLANVAYNASFAWADPGLTSLEAQMHVPMFNRDPIELGVEGAGEALVARIGADRQYEAMFAAAFPSETPRVQLATIVKAIAAFERTLISGRSAYDRRVYLDERSAMSEAARNGMRLFFGERLGCFRCHHGFNFSGPVIAAGQPRRRLEFHNTGLYNLRGKSLYPEDNHGLAEHTERKRDMGRFRAPTLRNIALTAPYMHDGSIATLQEVIDHYAAGGRTITVGPLAGAGSSNRYKSPLVSGFRLTASEKSELVAFLHSLTDTGFVEDPRFSNPRPGQAAAIAPAAAP